MRLLKNTVYNFIEHWAGTCTKKICLYSWQKSKFWRQFKKLYHDSMNNPIISIAKKWKKENASKKTGGKWALHAHLASLSFSFSYPHSFSLSLPYPTKNLGRPNTHFLLGLMIGSFFSCEHAITLFFFAPTSIPLLVVFGYDEWRETEKEREREGLL